MINQITAAPNIIQHAGYNVSNIASIVGFSFSSAVARIFSNSFDVMSANVEAPVFNSRYWMNILPEDIPGNISFQEQYEDDKIKYVVLQDETKQTVAVLYEYTTQDYDEYDHLEKTTCFSKIHVIASRELCAELIKRIKAKIKKFDVSDRQFRADLIVTDGSENDVRTTKLLSVDDILYAAYPYLDNLEEQFDSYLSSKQTIMLMQGPPGTGKTTLIKHLGAKMLGGQTDKRAVLLNITSNGELVTAQQFKKVVAEVISSQNALIVLEDSDSLVKSRDEGNSAITPLFTLIDGLFDLKNRWVFTTNLEDTSKIDQALLRPGRCHSFIKTRKLEVKELFHLAEVLKITDKDILIKINKSLSLAEFFHLQETIQYGKFRNTGEIKNKVGFI